MTSGLRRERRDDPELGLSIAEPQTLPQVDSWTQSDGTAPRGYGEMIAELRAFLDHLAAARPCTASRWCMAFQVCRR